MKEIVDRTCCSLLRFAICITMFAVSSSSPAQTKRALVFGVSGYPQSTNYSWGNIHGSNDADLVTSVLNRQGFNTVKICNQAATSKRIRKELKNLPATCRPGDLVYIHFSCHGQPFEDNNGDEEDGWDESIVPYDALKIYKKKVYEGQNHITDDELNTYFNKVRRVVGPKGYVCVVVDACHAGGSSRGEDDIDDEELYVRGTKSGFSPNGKEFRPRINAKSNFKIPHDKGLADITILEACRSYESNYEIKKDGKYYGPLTYFVSQTLAKQQLSRSLDWVKQVQNLMKENLTRQNMVYETSIK